MLYLAEEDVRALLPMTEAIRLMRETFQALAGETAQNLPRRRLLIPSGAVLHSMAGACGAYFGAKVYATHPKHGAHFVFLLYDSDTARPLALIEANWLGQIRTGAASGLATGLLARPDAGRIGIIGTGFQARSQLEAMLAVRKVDTVRIFSRTEERRRRFAAECAAFGVEVVAASTAREAVAGADIVVTATWAKDPVLEDEWIGPGVHINAVGSNNARRRELPAGLVRRADLIVVDSLEQSRIESGDLLLALEPAQWNDPRLVELKEVVIGKAGRRSASDVTVFKSNGLGVEDVAAAGFVYQQARQHGRGRETGPAYS